MTPTPEAVALLPCPFCRARLDLNPAFSGKTGATFTHPGPPGGDWDKACIMTGVVVRDPERIAAWNRRALPAPTVSGEVEAVITDLQALVTDTDNHGGDRHDPDCLICTSPDRAAALLRQQAVENERLKGALKPLADMADTTVLRDGEPFEPADSDVLYAGPLTWGDARRARAALPQVQQEGEG